MKNYVLNMGRYNVRFWIVVALSISIVSVGVLADYMWGTIAVDVEVEEPLEILSYPDELNLFPGEKKEFNVTVINYASTDYTVILDFSLDNATYQEEYVTFGNETYTVVPGQQSLVAWLEVESYAPPTKTALTIEFRRYAPELIFNKVLSGKIAYDTFSASNGTSTDIPWTFDHEGWIVENGKLKSGEGGGHPTDIDVTDCIWEAKIQPMEIVVEGPQMTFQGPDGSHAAFDYYHIGRLLRVMIGPAGGNSVFKTKSFTLSTNVWHTMKVAVSNHNMKCYMDDTLIFDVTDTYVTPVPSVPWTGGLHPIRDGDLGYWDDIKIWKSNVITVANLQTGQKVELFDTSDSLVSSATVMVGENNATLDVSALSFPLTGYFKIYATDGTTLLHTTPLSEDIWGGDEYSITEE